MKMVTVFFRFDDYSEASPVAVEAGLVEALRNNGVCATFAVIPAVTEGSYHVSGCRGELPLGMAKIKFLQEAIRDGAVDVALHGWNHRTVSKSTPHSEFVGVPVQDQIQRIKKGQQAFRDKAHIEASVFVPPWNAYDAATLVALEQVGFACMSANRYGPSLEGSVRFAPITTDLAELRSAIAAAVKSQDKDPIVGVLLHPYDFEESGDPRAIATCQSFDEELQWLKQQACVQIVSVSQLARENQSLDAARFRANQPLWFESISPTFTRTTSATPFIWSEAGARRTKGLRALVTVASHLAAALAGLSFERTMRVVFEIGVELPAGILLLAVLTRALARRELHFRAMLVVSILIGMLVSSVGAHYRPW